VLAQRLGNAPGDGMVVRDPHDQAALALHQPCHPGPPVPRLGPVGPSACLVRPICGHPYRAVGQHVHVRPPNRMAEPW
jgi:hypothetical protein